MARPNDRGRSRRSCGGDSGLRSRRIRRAGFAARTGRAKSRCRRPATAGSDRPGRSSSTGSLRALPPGEIRVSALAPAFRNDDRTRPRRGGRKGRPGFPPVGLRAPLSGSTRHTDPEAFFSIRSRFQSAGPFVAEPLATSRAPSRAGASAVMHVDIAGWPRSSFLRSWPPTKTMLPSIKPTAAPPSGNPANALISASKEADRRAARLVDARTANAPEETTRPRDVTARTIGRRRLEDRRGRVEEIVGTEGAVHRRRRDRSFAAPEPRVQGFPERVHRRSPQ